MKTAEYDAIVHWLERRLATYSSIAATSNFVRRPATSDRVQAAQDTFNGLLHEAKSERQLCIERGGYLILQLPAILISNQG